MNLSVWWLRTVGIGPEAMPGAVNEDIFQSRLAYRNRIDFAGESLDDIGDKTMTVLAFDADFAGQNLSLYGEAAFDPLSQRIGVTGIEDDDITANFVPQLGRGS
jgi:hypothetical protein